MLEIKSTVTKNEECLWGVRFILRLEATEERISYLEEISIETSQTQKENPQDIQELQDNYKKCNIHIMGITEKKKREIKKIIEGIMTEIFQKLISDTKPHIPGSSENTNQDKCQKPTPI